MGILRINEIIRNLNQNKYKKKFPMLKIYSIPYIGQPDEETGIVKTVYLVTPVYGKNTLEVIKRLEKIQNGITRSINGLEEVRSKGARKITKELEKYHQQIESDMIRRKHSKSAKQ